MGINERGQEPGNGAATEGRDIPWLQDKDADGNSSSDVASDLWDLRYRDVVILDGENTQVGVFNLTDHDLAEPQNYSALRTMLVDAAMQSQLPWNNADNALDVDNDGLVIPLDVLLVVNQLNSVGSYRLPPPVETQSAPPYYDCSGDGDLSPLDALLVVNFLNEPGIGAGGEGESRPLSGQSPTGRTGGEGGIGARGSLAGLLAPVDRVDDSSQVSANVETAAKSLNTPHSEATDERLAADVGNGTCRESVEPNMQAQSDMLMPDDWFALVGSGLAPLALASPFDCSV